MKLRQYQQEAVDATWNDLFNNAGNPILVAPTGSGKSAIIGSICETAVQKYKGRVIVLAHRRELLSQNADKIQSFLPPLVPVGLYSAGLRRFATEEPVVCAGIQSIYNKAHLLGERHLVLIDEAHLVPADGEGMYRTFLDDLRKINPKLRIVGLTATPFRTGTGSLCRPDAIFQRICHEVPVAQLIADGWLCPLVSSAGVASVDTSQLHIRGGEFRQEETERAFDHLVSAACAEITAKTLGRKSILVFCQGVDHARHVQECLERMTSDEVGLVVGSTPSLEREATLRAFREQRLRWLVNCDILTTGFDSPSIDAIAVLRATMSAGLFAQMVGRGLRLSPSKADCLVLDFGENVERHGKLDDPSYGRRKKQQVEGAEGVQKQCPNCGELVAGGAAECECGFIFPERQEQIRHDHKASDAALIGYTTEKEWFAVESVSYSRHNGKEGKPDTMKVSYECKRELTGNVYEFIQEWVCIEHDGFARRKAAIWWSARSSSPCPLSIDEAVELATTLDEWREPVRIAAHKEGRFWRIDEVEMKDREVSFSFGGNDDDDDIPF